mgnify:CR=1 FL=1
MDLEITKEQYAYLIQLLENNLKDMNDENIQTDMIHNLYSKLVVLDSQKKQ